MTTDRSAGKKLRRVFIVGNPRSGTSLLRLMLTSHSAVIVPPECGFIVWLYDQYKTWRTSDCDSSAVRHQFLNHLYKCRKFETWGLDYWAVQREIVSKKPGSYAELCDVIYTAYGHLNDKWASIIGDKNNFHIDYLDILNKIFPDSLFLHIVRDGRDVACSYREVMNNQSSSPYAPRLETDIGPIANEWIRNLSKVKSFFASISGERKASIRYEDLVTKSDDSLRKICDWLDIKFETEMLNFHEFNKSKQLEPKLTMDWKRRTLSPISDETVGRHLVMLSKNERDAFDSVGSEVLIEFGYKQVP